MKNSREDEDSSIEWKPVGEWGDMLPPSYEKTRQLVQSIWEGQATVESVDALIQDGAEIEEDVFFYKIGSDGEKIRLGGNALIAAAMRGDANMVRLLLSLGADPNSKTRLDYYTPLSAAAGSKDMETLRLLLEAGAKTTRNGASPLVEAAKVGWQEGVQCLLDAGADVNAHLRDRFNALETAASYGHLGIARLLIEAGAEPRPADTEYSPLRAAARAQYFHPELLRLLLTYYPDVRTAPHVHNALVGAIDDRLTDATEILLAAGADPNAVGQSYDDDEGPITPLMAAISNDSLPAIRRLLAAGADPNKAVSGKNALDYALSVNPKPSVVRLLRAAGAHEFSSSRKPVF